MLYLWLAAVAVVSLVTGAIAALKIIAPATKTVKDDAALAFLEKVAEVLSPEHLAELKRLLGV